MRSTGSRSRRSTASDDIDTLYDVLLIASVPVFVLVMSVALYSVFAFRVKPGDMSDGAPIHGNTRLEVVWVTIPFLMVTALALYGWVVLDDIEAKETEPADRERDRASSSRGASTTPGRARSSRTSSCSRRAAASSSG